VEIVDEMTKYERVYAAVQGDEVDRIPVCFWHHFQPEGSGRMMADATLGFFLEKFDLDFIKIMPDIAYPFPRRSISDANDWHLLEPLNKEQSRFFTQRATAVRTLREMVGFDVPIIVTVYNPISEAMHFAQTNDLFMQHAQERPSVVHEAIATIAENLRIHIKDCIDAGADGVYFALQGCTAAAMTREQYRELGRPYDLLALQGNRDGWFNVLHVHGNQDLYIDDTLDYPVQVMSWSDRLAGPSLREVRSLTSKCLMGGWHEFGALSNGPVEKIREEAEDAIRQTGGRKFILANGCSVPDDTDEQWLHAARQIVDELELP